MNLIKIKNSIIREFTSLDDFTNLNNIMMKLVEDGYIVRYFIHKKVDSSGIFARYITITSEKGNNYKILFDSNFMEDIRNLRLMSLIS